MGESCPRALWYSVHHPELAQQVPPWVTFKYVYGHVVEALALELARASGHSVEGEQHECKLDGVTGHIDAIIDGAVVDVKSVTSHTLQALKGSFAESDQFGYCDQLDGYISALATEALVTVKDKGYILGVDKTLGHFQLYEHTVRTSRIRERIKYYQSIVSLGSPPPCECEVQPFGASGNICLGTKAKYSAFKFECFPGLRTFLYADGPKYLTVVKRKPEVPEVDKYGNICATF
jgi:hypothetical protein